MKFTFERKIIGLVIVFGILTAAVIGGVIWPTTSFIRDLDADTNNLKTYLEQRYDNTRRLRVSLRHMSEIREKVNGYDRHLVQAHDELSVITELEKIAAARTVVQKIENSNLDTPHDQLRLSLLVTGSFSDVLNYLVDLERMDYFINPETLVLSQDQTEGKPEANNQTSLRLTVSVYVIR